MSVKRMSLVVAMFASATMMFGCWRAGAARSPASAAPPLEPPITITRLYTGADGETHFEDVEIPLAEAGALRRLSKTSPANGIIFRKAPVGYFYDWHRAPRRQYVILLAGETEIEIGDGTKRRFGPGSILLAEDTTGHGHRSRSRASTPNLSIFVTLPESRGMSGHVPSRGEHHARPGK